MALSLVKAALATTIAPGLDRQSVEVGLIRVVDHTVNPEAAGGRGWGRLAVNP